MYLKNIIVQNNGPIEKVSFELPFDENGNPKPIILVGGNGSGKTILLSPIVDSLHEIANEAYDDVLPQKGLGHSYFKLVSPINQKVGTEYGFNFLMFDNLGEKIEYIEKTGKISFADCQKETKDLLTINGNWQVEDNYKANTRVKDNKNVKSDFLQNSYCYFPSVRYEDPHWLNLTKKEERFGISSKISGILGKPIVIEKALDQNKNWILDVFLDSRADIEENIDQSGKVVGFKAPDLVNVNQLRIGRKNIEKVLSLILDTNIILSTNYRGVELSRLKIMNKDGQTIIPSLDNLSLGQSVLFSLFSSIIRYSDQNNINKSIKLEDIKGIVVIDEVDVHLHANLQSEVLPKLVHLLPKVQFIMTTHSPLFLLGMEKEFGASGYEIRELPTGSKIPVERFTEFGVAYEIFSKTIKHEKELVNYLKSQTKQIVFCEGETDPEYIKKAIECFDYKFDGEIDIRWIGSKQDGGNFCSGTSGLDKAKEYIRANLDLINNKVILLYDCNEKDKTKTDEEFNCDFENKLFIRRIKRNDISLIKKGIENLFPKSLINKVRSNKKRYGMIKKRSVEDDHQKMITEYEIPNNKKVDLCKWVCENCTKKYFVNFSSIFIIIKSIFDKKLKNLPQN